MSITREQVRLEMIDEMRARRIRKIPVRCIHAAAGFLKKGELGVVSQEEFSGNKAFLVRVECPDFDSENYPGYGPLTKKKAVKADSAGGAE